MGVEMELLGRGEWGGHLRLFKQISGEYQSLKTLREMLWVRPPAAEAFVFPSRDRVVKWPREEGENEGTLRNMRGGESTCFTAPSIETLSGNFTASTCRRHLS